MKLFIALCITLISSAALAKPKVVATTSDLAAVCAAIGGDAVEVVSLSDPNEDPHYVDPRPDKILALNKADVLLVNGLGLESGWLPQLQKQARNSKISSSGSGYLDASRVVSLLDTDVVPDRAKGDIHAGGNPHFMLDAASGIAVGNMVRDHLKEIDPDNANVYESNSAQMNEALQKLISEQASRFRSIAKPSRNVVSYHKSLSYLIKWLGLYEVSTIEPKPGVPPNPKHVAKVLKSMKRAGVKVILQESFYPQKTAKTLAKIAKSNVVVFRGGTNFPKETYVEHMTHITNEIFDAIAK